MSQSSADRNLLFGILALQMDFITRDALISGMNAWVLEKHRSLGDLLVERDAIDPTDRALLDLMVDRHVAKHAGNPRAGIEALSSAASVASELRRSVAPDADLLASLASVRNSRFDDPYATRVNVPPAPHVTRSRFRKIRTHAAGNLGVVWIAKDEELNREVALKEIKEKNADHLHYQAKFLLEAEVTGGLEHPGIVPVYGLGYHDDGRPFYAMRLIRGRSLLDAIHGFHEDESLKSDPGRRVLELQKLLRRFADVCNAVAYAHSRGVLHRDLKPENVMVGKYGETLVVDWGLAKTLVRTGGMPGDAENDDHLPEESLQPSCSDHLEATQAGSLVGTPAYMSPEQAAGRLDLLGTASDVYGLGATLYHLLVGRHPVEGVTLSDLLANVQSGRFPRPRSLSPWLDPALEAICLKAMALKPDARYDTPKALAEDLDRWIADEPIRAWREPFSRRFSRWARRNRSWLAAAAGTLALVSLVSVVAVIVIDRARRETKASLIAESAARSEAGRRLAQSRESIDTLLTAVGEGLAKVPGAQKVRRQLLEKAAKQYEQLAVEKGDDPALRLESATARLRLGLIRIKFSDYASAEADFRAAEEILSGLAQPDGDPEVRLRLGTARSHLGSILVQLKQPEAAEEAYRKAIEDELVVLKTRPDDWKAFLQMGNARRNLAGMLADSKRFAEADALFHSGVADLEMASKSGEFKALNNLAGALNSYALMLKKLGRSREADEKFRSCVATASETVRRFPEEFEARENLAAGQRNLGDLLRDTGRREEAEPLYLAALTERETLARANPDVPDYRHFLASSRAGLGLFYAKRNLYKKAEDFYRAAIAEHSHLVQEHPDDQRYRDYLAIARSNFGTLLMELGRFPEAESEGRMANAEFRALWDTSPSNLAYGNKLGNGLNSLARIFRRMGQLDDAESALRAGLEVYERLAKEQPSVPSHRDMIALISNNIASLLGQRSRPESALPLARQAVAGYEILTKDHPTVLDYAEGLVMSRNTLGPILARLGAGEEAREVLVSSVDFARPLVASHPDIPLYLQRMIEGQAELSQVEAGLGRFDEAIRTLESAAGLLREAVDRHPKSSEFRRMVWEIATARAQVSLERGRLSAAVDALDQVIGEPCPVGVLAYNVACLYTRAASLAARESSSSQVSARRHEDIETLMNGYHHRAIDLLRKAMALGFRESRQYAQDQDLNPLRSRADFQRLMLDLAFPAEPFAR